MEELYIWGIGLIKVIQRIENPALTAAMKALTSLGSEYAYLALLPLVFWCVDERKGIRLGTVLLFSAWSNGALKEFLAHPRPYDIDPGVGRAVEDSFGFPSGHAQGSLTFWGVLAAWIPKPWGIFLAIVLPLGISFTRLYLGVHFPTDIAAGLLLGGAILAFYYGAGPLIVRLLRAANIRVRILVVALAAFGMNALHPGDTGMGGVFFGMGIGYILMKERFPFAAAKNAAGDKPALWNLSLRYLLGIIVAGGVYGGLKLLMPGEGHQWYALGRFGRYALLGFWVAAGAPWVFLQLRLAGKSSPL